MKKIAIFALLAASLFVGCTSEPMQIVCGKDFIQSRSVITDTTSEFHTSDPFVMQFRYGKNFDFANVKWEVVNEKGKVVVSRTNAVKPQEGSLTVRISSSRHGGFASAAEIFKAKEGNFTVRFSNGDADTLLMEKQIRVIRNSEKESK